MAHNAAHYERIGRSLYAAGLIIFFGTARSWQETARQRGYRQARETWLAQHPKSDEWENATMRNREFCKTAIRNDGV